jgi:galactokinase
MHDVEAFRSLHRTRFEAEPAIYAAPGRVNLIGEHTDYAEGFVMPVAINFATLAGISPRADGKIAIFSENYGQVRYFDAAELPAKAGKHWTDYPLGVISILAGEGHKIPGFSLSLWGDVPLGSGLSSSASVEVATALAVTGLLGVTYTGPVLARLCQRAENEFVGANCGIMDQFISANGAKDHALLLDCRDLSFVLAPIPEHVALVIANTMVKHAITGGHRQPPAGGHVPARRDGGGPGEMGRRDDAQLAQARAARDHGEHAHGGGGRGTDCRRPGHAGQADGGSALELQQGF